MLLYHPATDFFHCWMRFAFILCKCGDNGIEFDRVRIIDFLLCFPQELNNCTLPVKFRQILSQQLKQLPKTYEDPYSIRQGFAQMKKVQCQVAMDMVAKGIVQRDAYREGVLIPRTESENVSMLLESVAQNWNVKDENLQNMTITALLSIPLNGKNGLKERSGLMEFRYDA